MAKRVAHPGILADLPRNVRTAVYVVAVPVLTAFVLALCGCRRAAQIVSIGGLFVSAVCQILIADSRCRYDSFWHGTVNVLSLIKGAFTFAVWAPLWIGIDCAFWIWSAAGRGKGRRRKAAARKKRPNR